MMKTISQCELIKREGRLIERVCEDLKVGWEDVIERHARLIRALVERGMLK